MDYLTKAQAASKHLLHFMGDILEVTRIESEQISLLETDFTLAEASGRVMGVLERQARNKHLRLDLQMAQRMGATALVADSLRPGQVLNNLIGNAIKFTAAGGVTVSVTSTAGCAADEVVRIQVLLRQLRPGARVLLVEDAEINRYFGAEPLKESGLHVDTAETGEHAVELASSNDCAAVLMDVKMLAMDGMEATRRIRLLANVASIPVLDMTALAFRENELHCLDSGMNDYMAKPIDRETLAHMLLMWLLPRAKRPFNVVARGGWLSSRCLIAGTKQSRRLWPRTCLSCRCSPARHD